MTRTALDPRKTPAQQRSRRTVERILDSAARVFAEHGYARGTTDRIAAAAGLSVGSLYQYFPNKDAILVALLDRHVDEVAARLASAHEAASAMPLAERVRYFVAVMVELHAIEPRLHAVLFEEAPRPERARAAMRAVEDAVAEQLAAELRVAPGVALADPGLAARLVVRTVEALTHGFVLDGDDGGMVAEELYVDEVTKLVLRYLTGGA